MPNQTAGGGQVCGKGLVILVKTLSRTHVRLLYVSMLAILYWLASQMLRPAVALYIADTMGHPLLVGGVVAIQAMLPLFIAVLVGSLSDRLGFNLSSALGASAMVGAGWLYFGTSELWGLIMAQVLSGVGELFVWTALQASASRLGEGEGSNKQELYIGYFTLAVAVGQFLGPLSTGILLGIADYNTVFLAFIGISVVLAAFCWLSWTGERRMNARLAGDIRNARGQGEKLSPLVIVGNPLIRASLLSSFTMLFITGVFSSFFPILLRDHLGYAEAAVGIYLAVRTGGAFVIRPMMAAILERFGLARTLVWSTGIAVATLAVVPLLQVPVVLASAMFIGGLAMGLNNPLTMLVIAQYTSAAHRGLGMGIRLFVNRAAHVLSPLVFGVAAGAMNIQSGFYTSGGLLTGVVVLIARLSSRSDDPARRFPDETVSS